MPKIRCRHYNSDGTPIGSGCLNPNCSFVHPSDKRLWRSIPPTKTLVRCWHFDNEGKVIGTGCWSGSRDCRFIHPDDSRWGLAEPHIPKSRETRRSQLERAPVKGPSLNLPPVSLGSHSGRGGSSKDDRDITSLNIADVSPSSLPKLQIETRKEAQLTEPAHSSPTSVSPTFIKSNDRATPVISKTTQLASIHTSVSIPAMSSISSVITRPDPTQSPIAPASATSQSFEGDKRWMWKKFFSLLSQTNVLKDQVHDIDAKVDIRNALQAMGIGSTIAPSARGTSEDFFLSSKESRDLLEERHNSIITQLVELDCWPLLDEPIVQVGGSALIESYAALASRVDAAEAQLKKYAVVDIPVDRRTGTTTTAATSETDAMDIDNPPGRPLKRHRASPEASSTSMRSSTFSHTMDRLDRVQAQLTKLEREALDEERIAEIVEELLEDALRANSGLVKSAADLADANPSSLPPSADPEPLKTVVKKLDSDFDVLCDELAEIVSTKGKLELDTKELRVETNALKESGTNLAMSQQSLRATLDEMGRQTRDIATNLMEMQLTPSPSPYFQDERDKIVRGVTENVQSRLDSSLEHLKNIIKSQDMDIQKTAITSLEPTLVQTQKIYAAMARLEVRGEALQT